MRRRDFIAGVGGAVAWSLEAQAQQRAMPVIGYLNGITESVGAPTAEAFRQGLSQ